MLPIQGLHHATLTTADPERSAEFYGGVLGFEDITPPEMARRLDFPFLWFNLGNVHLHVIYNRSPACRSGLDEKGPSRANHIAFAVADIGPVRKRLEAAGLPVVEGTIGLRQFYVRDPDGNIIEFIEPPKV